MNQQELRQAIKRIQDSGMNDEQKARAMQELMTRKWSEHNHQNNQIEHQQGMQDYSGSIGCKHYSRGCKIKPECCQKWYVCRFCHDEASPHKMDRRNIKEIQCMKCSTIQPPTQNCSKCHSNFAHYFCSICNLYDDDKHKHIYHCEKCGICRIGKGLGIDYFHCDKCNVCMAMALQHNHKCIERNLESDCPICGDYLFESTHMVIFMPCGHSIHHSCHAEHIQSSYQCPTCLKSLGDMSDYFRRLDDMLNNSEMPTEYENVISSILCNDCEAKSEQKYHFLYHKCVECGSYNTKLLSTSSMEGRNHQIDEIEQLEIEQPQFHRRVSSDQ